MIIDRALETIKKWDEKVSYQFFKRVPKTARAKSLLKSLEWSCNGLIWLPACLALIYLYPNNPTFSNLMAGLIMDVVYVAVIKAYARRRRPQYAAQDDQFGVMSVDKHSLPSGHATRAIYVGFFMSSSHPVVSFIIWTWAVAVAVSRVLLGRHHVADVIVGVFVAFVNFSGQFFVLSPLYDLLVWFFKSGLVASFSSTNDLVNDGGGHVYDD